MKAKDILNFKSPLPIKGPAKDCVELIIYDNDGPEGYFNRLRFERSADAVWFLHCYFPAKRDLVDLNFKLTNHWSK